MLPHGGNLSAAVGRYGIPRADWLDLSTGLNPAAYPVGAVELAHWHHLPARDDGLAEAAQGYYGGEGWLPVAGSQAAIQALPRLRTPGRVGVLTPSYAEHTHCWQQAGHTLCPLAPADIDGAVADLDALVLVNPNNPTGHLLARDRLLAWHERLAQRGGWLVVDEAFMDCTPEHSLAPYTHRTGLIVLRSLGKFFGLAGARVGFVGAETELLASLEAYLGPWPISGPARQVARQALADTAWQRANRQALDDAGQQLADLLAAHGLPPAGGTPLFQWLRHPRAATLHDALARRGIWVRLFDDPVSLRFGLPGQADQWQRLEAALGQLPA